MSQPIHTKQDRQKEATVLLGGPTVVSEENPGFSLDSPYPHYTQNVKNENSGDGALFNPVFVECWRILYRRGRAILEAEQAAAAGVGQ